jgi:hypothetical protein
MAMNSQESVDNKPNPAVRPYASRGSTSEFPGSVAAPPILPTNRFRSSAQQPRLNVALTTALRDFVGRTLTREDVSQLRDLVEEQLPFARGNPLLSRLLPFEVGSEIVVQEIRHWVEFVATRLSYFITDFAPCVDARDLTDAEIIGCEPVLAACGRHANAVTLRRLDSGDVQIVYGTETLFQHLVDLFALRVPGVRAKCSGPGWKKFGAVVVNIDFQQASRKRRRKLRRNRPRIVHELLPPPAALVGFRLSYRPSVKLHFVCSDRREISVRAHLATHNDELRREIMPGLLKHLYRWKKPKDRKELVALQGSIEQENCLRKESALCNSNRPQEEKWKHFRVSPQSASPARQGGRETSVGAERSRP